MKKVICMMLLSLSLPLSAKNHDQLLQKEWIETNGLGSVISGSSGLANTRNYHAHYSTLNKNGDRIILVNNFEVYLEDQNKHKTFLSSHLYPKETIFPDGINQIKSFAAFPNPTWTFYIDTKTTIEKELIYLRSTNTVLMRFNLSGVGNYKLIVRPLLTGRSYFGIRQSYHTVGNFPYTANADNINFHWDNNYYNFYLTHNGVWKSQEYTYWNMTYPLTIKRGEDGIENLFSPGEIEFALDVDNPSALIALDTSLFPLSEINDAFDKEISKRKSQMEKITSNDPRLKLMAHNSWHYLFTRLDGQSSILAGFPWFLDWGRDTFISMEGLLLTMRRFDEAHEILRNFARFEKNGLLPNMFPSFGSEPVYNSVDAPLWFIHAAFTTLEYDRNTDRFQNELWPTIQNIINSFIAGTTYNIKMDPQDGLIIADADHVQLTWMDAKLGDWVVTPRRGKPIEISALWFQALKNSISWCKINNLPIPLGWKNALLLISNNFEHKFSAPNKEYLVDVADAFNFEESELLRPNVLFALNFAKELLTKKIALNTLAAVENNLLTPYGLRSLAPFEKKYIGKYEGTLASRDGAYHQGTTWSFLIGQYIDAKLNWRDNTSSQQLVTAINSLLQHSEDYSIGHISEIFDGDEPWNPAGCFAQAWSDAEVLRVSKKLGLWKFNNL